MSKTTRRDFIKKSVLITAGTYAGMLSVGPAKAARMGGGMGGGGMGGSSIINPPIGALFTDPVTAAPLISTDPMTGKRVVEVSVEAKMARINVNGTSADLMTYNGLYPGPTIRAKNSDLLRVRFKNSLPTSLGTNMLGHPRYVTNLHTHGLHVSPGDNMNGTHSDNMLVVAMPGTGTNYTDRGLMYEYDGSVYEYDLSRHPAGNLNFYHPHIHGNVSDQMWAGMAGALVIEDDETTLSNYETHLLMLHDLALSGSSPAPHSMMMDYMHGKEGNIVMVNGQVNPLLYIKPGQVQRWRIVNASVARFYRLSLEGHSMHLIGTEGGLVDRPYQINEIIVSPGERVDLLVKANQAAKTYRLLSLPYDRGMNTLQQVTLLSMQYKGQSSTEALPSVVNPNAARLDFATAMLPPESFKTISLSMGQGRGYINGETFTDHENCDVEMSMVGGYEVWEIINQSGMDHPFHHHVNHAQVLSITGGDAKYASLYTTVPAMKDVTIVPKWGRVELLMPVMDYTGMGMIHCHIIEHEDIGMMAMWHLMGDSMPM